MDVFRTISSAKCSLFGPVFDCTQPQIKEDDEMELLQNLPGFLVVFSNILKYLDSQNLCQLRLTCKQLASMVRQEKNYRNRILRGIEDNVNAASIAHLNPFKSWTPEIISKISDSDSIESLELLGVIIRRHSNQLHKWNIEAPNKTLTALGSLFYYFTHEKSTIEEFQLLARSCDVQNDANEIKEDAKDNFGNNILHILAWAGRIDIIKTIKNWEKIISKNDSQMTALHVAKDDETLTYLLNGLKKLSYNIAKKYFLTKDVQGRTVLHHMASKGNAKAVKLLLKKMKEFNPDCDPGYLLLNSSYNPVFNPLDDDGKTPIKLAFDEGHYGQISKVYNDLYIDHEIIENYSMDSAYIPFRGGIPVQYKKKSDDCSSTGWYQ